MLHLFLHVIISIYQLILMYLLIYRQEHYANCQPVSLNVDPIDLSFIVLFYLCSFLFQLIFFYVLYIYILKNGYMISK
jgi:hypothetical protein